MYLHLMQFSVTTKVIRFPKKGCCPRLTSQSVDPLFCHASLEPV
jgi:hypothetical protein